MRDLEFFNCALIGKWLWRYLDDENTLWAIIISSLHDQVDVREGDFVSNRG